MTIKSKSRVKHQGEVFTSEREVSAMLDLVRHETERIESRFLEPACGDGNFLAPILENKINIVTKRYKKSQLEYERNIVTAVGSIYGVEYLEDNVEDCRKRLYEIFFKNYDLLFGKKVKKQICNSIKYIIQRNIIWGDALTLTTPNKINQPIVFSEWSRPFNDSRVKRHDYYFHELTPNEKRDLFSKGVISDEGKEGFIPEPVKSYPLIHITKIGEI